jgi:hypothetical protein
MKGTVSVNILNKESGTDDKGRISSSADGRRTNNFCP